MRKILSPTEPSENAERIREGVRKLGRIDPAILLEEMQKRADLLRQTADDLATGKINPHHAANRIRRIANEIAKARESK